MKNYVAVSGLVFALVAVAQASRALMELPARIGSFDVPVWASWIAAAAAAILCVWAFASKE